MNPMLQKHCAKYIYIVPQGLRELMSDISREVIRAQPQDIYTFIADYLDAMMITRENARVAIRLIDSISEIAETVVELLTRTGMSREAADEIVKVIQRHFREYLERKKLLEHPEELGEGDDEVEAFTQRIMREISVGYERLVEVTTIIQKAYIKFKERREREKLEMFGMIDWRVAAAATIRLYRRTGVTRYEADRAATLIKAAYKGYYTRRIMKRLLNPVPDDQTVVKTSIETDAHPDIPKIPMEDKESIGSYHEVEEEYLTGESLPTDIISEADEQEQEIKGEKTEISEHQITIDNEQLEEGFLTGSYDESDYYGEQPGEILIELKSETPPQFEEVEVPPLEDVDEEASTEPYTTDVESEGSEEG